MDTASTIGGGGRNPNWGVLKLSQFCSDNYSMTPTTILAVPEVQIPPAAPPSSDVEVDADEVTADDGHTPPVEAPGSRATRALDLLGRLAGPDGLDLPVSLGRSLVRLEAHLNDGPVPLDSTVATPLEVVVALEGLLRCTAAVHDLIIEGTEVLSDALAVDLTSFPLARLEELAEAILGLSLAPRSAAGWGQPDAAQAAETVLQVAADDLRTSAREHAALYRRYTEYVWDVPTHLLQAGQRRWRFIARARLAQQLRAVSRTDRIPRGLTAAAREILEVRSVRARLVSMSPLLTHHLAELDQGPLSDVDAALAAVGAVRRLQTVLGESLVPDRLERLLLAEAFASPDVLSPAVNLRNAILAWRHDLASVGGEVNGTRAWSDLARWADTCDQLLPLLQEGQAAAARLGIAAPTLRSLADLLLLREHVAELVAAEVSSGAAGGAA